MEQDQNLTDKDVHTFDEEFNGIESRVIHLEGQGRRDQLLLHRLDDIPEDRSEHNLIAYMGVKLNQ